MENNNPDNWEWGFFYYNKNDERSIVPKRIGWGWTLNFAHKKAVIGFILIILIILFSINFLHH